ncbi:MAG: signal recognition particle-docking protein FtsY [Nitrospirota bacterium]
MKTFLNKLNESLSNLFLGSKQIDTTLIERIEDLLIGSDIGVKATTMLIRTIEEKAKRKELSDPSQINAHLKREIYRILSSASPELRIESVKPAIIMVVGVNGTGKTTTIAKLARRFSHQGKKVILAAGDTFRAAAIEQLSLWAERVGADIVKHKDGADPSAVVYDAIQSAKGRNKDILIIDTAGRLHTKVNLMEEMKKINRVIGKSMDGAPHETLLVIDATTGQNAIMQARMFHDAIGITGIILTKLDSTAKGGVVIAIMMELDIPVKMLGVGEGIDDLIDFDAEKYTEALFG